MRKTILILVVFPLLIIGSCSRQNNGGCTNTFTINGDGHTNEVFTLQTEPVSYLNGLVVTYNSNGPYYTLINSIVIPYKSSLNSTITIQANLPNMNIGSHSLIKPQNINQTLSTDSFYLIFNLVDNLGNSYTYYSTTGTINIQSIPNCTGGGGSMAICNLSGQFNNVVLARLNYSTSLPISGSYVTLSNSSFCAQKQF